MDSVLDLVASRGAVARLCVVQGGRALVDRSFGCAPDSLLHRVGGPQRDLVFAYLTNEVRGQAAAVRHHAAVADAVRQELDGSSTTPSSSA